MTLPASQILIADDDPLLVELLEYKLEARGYEVLKADDGPSALEAAQKEQPALIVLDAMMPGFDGFEVLRRLKDDETTAGIPVVMLTARKAENDVLQGLSLGAHDYLVKPFMPQELVTRISKILGERDNST